MDILKEAIADAKKIRDTAIENAKATLTESLAPKLQSMLEKKLQEIEEEHVDENQIQGLEEEFNLDEILNEFAEGDELEEAKSDDNNSDKKSDDKKSDDKKSDDKESKSDSKPKSDSKSKSSEPKSEDEKDLKDLSVEDFKKLIKDIIQSEITSPEDNLGDEGMSGIDDVGEDDNLDGEEDLDGDIDLELDDDFDIDNGGLGGDNIKDEEDDFNLDELLAELETLDNTNVNESRKLIKAKKELNESKKAIKKLTYTLNEVNLLNAKLLYTNRIFKSMQLNESQKVDILAKFDKAKNIREVKLIYEALKLKETKPTRKILNNRTAIRENLGFASKSVGNTTKTDKTIVDPMVARWQKLANIKK